MFTDLRIEALPGHDARACLIYTGGTIGSVPRDSANPASPNLRPASLDDLLVSIPDIGKGPFQNNQMNSDADASLPTSLFPTSPRLRRACFLDIPKVSSESWQGFDSPNFPWLTTIGERIKVHKNLLRRAPDTPSSSRFCHARTSLASPVPTPSVATLVKDHDPHRATSLPGHRLMSHCTLHFRKSLHQPRQRYSAQDTPLPRNLRSPPAGARGMCGCASLSLSSSCFG